jgi:hypothetical protein
MYQRDPEERHLMLPANDANPLPDVASMRRSLQTNVAKLLDAKDHLANQIAALGAVERQVRALALRESRRCLVEEADPAELLRLGELQAETNANFRQMQETYVNLSAQIAAMLTQHQRLYDATFAQSGRGYDPS